MIATLITTLYLLGFMGAQHAYVFLYICGAILIISEIAFTVFGILAFNGLLAIYVGYAIQTGDNSLLGLPLDWSLLFGIAFIELAIVIASVIIIKKLHNAPSVTGGESMVGDEAAVVEWDGKAGSVRIQGEIWKAASESGQAMELKAGETVTVREVKGLTLKVGR